MGSGFMPGSGPLARGYVMGSVLTGLVSLVFWIRAINTDGRLDLGIVIAAGVAAVVGSTIGFATHDGEPAPWPRRSGLWLVAVAGSMAAGLLGAGMLAAFYWTGAH